MTADERRASLIDATIPLLQDKGSAVSTREIATAAGVAEGTIFRVFSSKDELIRACVRQAFDTSGLHRELRAVDPALPLAERLTAAVHVMQRHLIGIFSLMTVLHATGQPLERPSLRDSARQRERDAAEIDAAFVALIGSDAALLRVPASKVVDYLRMITLSSVHPMLGGQHTSSAAELVDIILDGALARPASTAPATAIPALARPTTAQPTTSRGM